MNDKTMGAERLRQLFAFEQETGELIRRTTCNARHPAGAVAGTTHSNGYRVVGIDGRIYKAHRLAWLHFYGEWPKGEIDHINGDKADNRITNLRVVTRSENMMNRFRARRDNRLGVLGVTQIGSRFIARFKDKYLGSFGTPEIAHAAYQTAKQQDNT